MSKKGQLVGFITQRSKIPLESKLGGKPFWLCPTDLPDARLNLTCPKCNILMTFIMQIFAKQDCDSTFHRFLYIFGCFKCGLEFKAIRCQLPKLNDFYKSDLDEMYEIQPIKDICEKCGLPKPHSVCGNVLTENSIYFKEQIDSESSEDERETVETRLDDISEYSFGSSEEALFDEVHETLKDEVFDKFCKFMNKAKSHIVRYQYNGNPILFTADDLKGISNCEYCNSPRTFEFQIQPTLINIKAFSMLDFATLLVYTCSKNCSSSAYMEEFIYRQKDDF